MLGLPRESNMTLQDGYEITDAGFHPLAGPSA
jgi:hypothetical protein